MPLYKAKASQLHPFPTLSQNVRGHEVEAEVQAAEGVQAEGWSVWSIWFV